MPRKNSKHLTDPGIAKIAKAAPGKRVERFDAGAPGLALRVTDRSAKSWSVYYRLDGKHQRETIGKWPEVGVADARDRARDIKKLAAAGIDPRSVRQAEEAEAKSQAEAEPERLKTFGPLAENYIKRECPKLAQGANIESIIRRAILPHWGNRPVVELRRRDAIALTDSLVDAGLPAAAAKLHGVIKRLGNWLVERDDIEASPFARMKSPADKVTRDRALKDYEIRAVWLASDEMGYPSGTLVKLLLLTGQRRNEVAGIQEDEIDKETACWVIPAARTKRVKGVAKPHLVPLAPAVMEIINTLPRFAGPHLLTTTSGIRPVSGFSKTKTRLDELVGRHGNGKDIKSWRLHDLRRTCRTGLASLGVPEIVSEKVLAHYPRGLSKIYNVHEYQDEKRDALARWAQRVQDIVTPPPAIVVMAGRS